MSWLWLGLGRGRCEVSLIKTDIDLKYEWQNKIHIQIMIFEKNTINDLWSEYETTSGDSSEKKISNNFFLQCSLPMSVSKTTIKKNMGHHASYLFVLRSDEELTLGTSAWNSLRRFVILSHRRSTIVSFETYPLYLHFLLPGLVDSYNVVRL